MNREKERERERERETKGKIWFLSYIYSIHMNVEAIYISVNINNVS